MDRIAPIRCDTCNGTSEVTRGERHPNIPWETREWVEACPNADCRNGVLRCGSCGEEDAVALDRNGDPIGATCQAEVCDECDGSGTRSFHVSSESDSWAAGWDGEEPCPECEGTGRIPVEDAAPRSGALAQQTGESEGRDVFLPVAGGTMAGGVARVSR